SLSDFNTWLTRKEKTKCIELKPVKKTTNLLIYEHKIRYVCSRRGTGGAKQYEKKHPERQYKLENKRTGCLCDPTVKQYPGTGTVLGNYQAEHNHDTGNANLVYTRIPKETREYITGLLRLKVSPDRIVRSFSPHRLS
ncbi:hypothetical protein C8R45DRAFT_848529, partial [Mycena sanguinolenta]